MVAVTGPSNARTTAAAPAPQRASNPVPGPGRSASEATTRATRAEPAEMESVPAASASMPACADPAHRAPPTVAARLNEAARNAKLGPSAEGGRLVPQ